MSKFVALVLCLAVATPAFAQSSHYVRGHVTKNGTYVAPHYQTNPDSSVLNNWSTRGNYNPYTGKAGTVDPYSSSPYSSSNSNPYSSTPSTATQDPYCYVNCPN
jgi:hypothetical protein